MNISLTSEQEQIVNDQLRSGHFRSTEEVITEAVVALREKVHTSSLSSSGGNGAQADAVREMLDFAQKNRTPLQGVSVKQLIHEGHRL